MSNPSRGSLRRFLILSVLVFSLLLSPLLLTACGAKPDVINVTLDSEEQPPSEATNLPSAPTPESAPPSQTIGGETMETAAGQSGTPESEAASRPTGAEPNPNSPFMRMKAEEQSGLINWLQEVGRCYASIAQSFASFSSGNASLIEDLASGKKLSELPLYQNLKDEVRQSLEALAGYSSALSSNELTALRQASDEISNWYLAFFPALEEQANSDYRGVNGWLKQKMDEIAALLQAFLNQLTTIHS